MPTALKASRIAATPKDFDEVGRRAQHQLPQHVGDILQLARESVDMRRVAFAEFCHGGLGAALAGEEMAAVGSGQEILRAALDDFQAVIGQL